ncbi:GSCOCG00005860001-RA-CDS, partial [Cotesia congregata]
IPTEAVEILISSLTDSTLKQYNVALKNWWSYCQSTNRDPLQPDIYLVLKYLTFRFNQDASYGTLNSERSAIYLISTIDLGSDPSISRFFKGVFKNRPPKPKYDTTWNTEAVLNWVEALGPLKTLDLKTLTFKLVSLLALATAHRVQTLSLIKLSDMIISKTNVIIKVSDQIKTSRVGAAQPSFNLPFFKERKSACVTTVLLEYLKRTKDLRGKEDYLFITYKRPYRRATPQSISRWIRCCLVEAGIDPKYTAHSTRHAATSAAEAKGLDVSIIKSTAGWSASSQVFAKFYKHPIEP